MRRHGRRVALVGLGSSRYAALGAASRLRASGIAAWADFASDTAGPEPAADLVVVAISASGATAEVVETARRHRGRSLVIAVTNATDPRLAAEADVVLPLYAGIEASGIATRTYRATVAVLALLADRLTGDATDGVDRQRPAVEGLAGVLEGRDAWLGSAADLFDGAAAIDVIGEAADQGTVEQAALMLREAPRLPASAHETADWLHTAIYLALPGHRALLMTGSPVDGDVVRVIAGRGGATATVGAPVARCDAGHPGRRATSGRYACPERHRWARPPGRRGAPGRRTVATRRGDRDGDLIQRGSCALLADVVEREVDLPLVAGVPHAALPAAVDRRCRQPRSRR